MEKEKQSIILQNERIAAETWLMRLERNGLRFKAGELIALHGAAPFEQRDYSIASGEKDETIDILYKLIPHGKLTPQLVRWKAGETARFSGPYGNFTLRDTTRKIVFIATGTGIAPCVSFVRSYPELNYEIWHGVKNEEELYFKDQLETFDYHPCLSQAADSPWSGRVTEQLTRKELDANAHYYLCGANEMIYEVSELLEKHGIDKQQIFAEPYYYRSA